MHTWVIWFHKTFYSKVWFFKDFFFTLAVVVVCVSDTTHGEI